MDCYDYDLDNEVPSLGQIAEAGLGIQGGTVSHNPATHDGIALPGQAVHHPFLDIPRDQIVSSHSQRQPLSFNFANASQVFAGRLYEKTSLQLVCCCYSLYKYCLPLC